jgi:hypothetical protein
MATHDTAVIEGPNIPQGWRDAGYRYAAVCADCGFIKYTISYTVACQAEDDHRRQQ